jgi:thioredoxin 1
MKSVICSFLVFLSLFVQAQDVIHLNATSFQEVIQSVDGIILDVRTQKETRSGIISDASIVDYYDSDFSNKIKLIQKDKPVFVYCRSGGRSSKAAEQLLKQGQHQVYNLIGGISAWQKAKLPIEKHSSIDDSEDQFLSLTEFDDIIVKKKFVLANFYTQWCVPCKKMIPILNNFEKISTSDIIRVDIDRAEDLSQYYNIKAVPTLILFYKGSEVWRHSGFISEESLRVATSNIIKKASEND